MANTANIVRIPLEEVHENPDNNKIFSMDKIDRLADTIEDEGFVGAIEVFKISDHYYEISSGHRRFEAMKMVGEKQFHVLYFQICLKQTRQNDCLIQI